MIAGCDALIANMTPFRGPGLDAATALEMGVMAGYGRPIVGYSTEAQSYKDRLPICSRKSKRRFLSCRLLILISLIPEKSKYLN